MTIQCVNAPPVRYESATPNDAQPNVKNRVRKKSSKIRIYVGPFLFIKVRIRDYMFTEWLFWIYRNCLICHVIAYCSW